MTQASSYTDRQIDWLRHNASRFETIEELAEAFNQRYADDRTVGAIKATLSREGIKRGRGRPQPHRRMLDPEQHAFLEDAFTRHSVADCTRMINAWWETEFTVEQIKAYTTRYKLASGRTGRFEKGQARVPGSGAKGPNSTSFKKGRPAHEASNYLPIGSLRFTRDGYMERKVTDDPNLVPARRWVMEHRLIWEAEHGPVPDGHVVVFLDGDRLNLELDNLRCVPRGVLQRLNHRTKKLKAGELKGEARAAALAVAELEHRIGERTKA